jgi:RIO-like serine/threonine protein kinase
VAAPRLRDAALPPARLRQAYTEMVVTMRTMFQACRLVHADLSEYNILYHKVGAFRVEQDGWCMVVISRLPLCGTCVMCQPN